MKKYAVAYINFFDNDLKMSIQEAENEVDACKKHLLNNNVSDEKNSWVYNLPDNLEELQYEMFNMDSQINAIEI